jgi:hypothetical protein
MSSNDQLGLSKLGYGFSLVLALTAVYSLVQVLRSVKQVHHNFLGFDVNLIMLIPCIGFGAIMVYADIKNWRPWTALFLSPAIINIVNLFSNQGELLVILANIISIMLVTYSFISFRKNIQTNKKDWGQA